MALLTSEVQRIRFELGYSVMSSSVYVSSYFASLESILSSYLQSGASTTCATSVTAATSPTLVTLTLASVTGVSAGATVVIDVDARQERATVESVSGSTISVLLEKAHSGTYPVTVEGGEAIVRDLCNKLRDISEQVATSWSRSGVKKVDEIEFFEGASSVTKGLLHVRDVVRDDLASALGVENRNARRSSGGILEMY